jgi:hypothetical protein
VSGESQRVLFKGGLLMDHPGEDHARRADHGHQSIGSVRRLLYAGEKENRRRIGGHEDQNPDRPWH